MSQGSADAAPPGGAAGTIKAGLTTLRFLVSDRLGIMALVWILVALVLRPMLLAVHDGAAMPLLSGLAKDPVGLSRFTGLIQWLSLALPIVIVALAHIRLPAAATVGISPALRAFLLPAVYAVVFFTGYLAFVWTPTTYLSLITSEPSYSSTPPTGSPMASTRIPTSPQPSAPPRSICPPGLPISPAAMPDRSNSLPLRLHWSWGSFALTPACAASPRASPQPWWS